MGILVVRLGAEIAGGGEGMQGYILGAAGLGLIAASALVGFSSSQGPTTADGTPAAGPPTEAQASTNAALGAGGLAAVSPLVLLGGGAAAAGLIGSMLIPPAKVPSSTYPNGQPPDESGWLGYQEFPSQTALRGLVS
jgi:hypothetical protein